MNPFGFIASFFGGLVSKVVIWYAQIRMIRKAERDKMRLEQQEKEIRAEKWKADNPIDLGGGNLDDFRVRPVQPGTDKLSGKSARKTRTK